MKAAVTTNATPGWLEAFRNRMNGKVNALVMGGTGAIGKSLVSNALESNAFEKIILLSRRPLTGSPYDSSDGRLEVKVVDFEKPAREAVEDTQVFFCCHGTTRKQAGSDAEFRKIDKEYVLNVTKVWKDANQNRADQLEMVLCTAAGANASSWMLYPKTKGELENELAALNFSQFSVIRPAFLRGRPSGRFAEDIATKYVIPSIDLFVSSKKTSVHIDEAAMAMLKIGISRPSESAKRETRPNGGSFVLYGNPEIVNIAAEESPSLLRSW